VTAHTEVIHSLALKRYLQDLPMSALNPTREMAFSEFGPKPMQSKKSHSDKEDLSGLCHLVSGLKISVLKYQGPWHEHRLKSHSLSSA
jgi:hypothetical protein